jgi:hypothetical protein
MEEIKEEMENMESKQEDLRGIKGFFHKYGPMLFLGGFIVYIILLFIGLIAEIFDIESILDWWIWRPPGKYK